MDVSVTKVKPEVYKERFDVELGKMDVSVTKAKPAEESIIALTEVPKSARNQRTVRMA